MSFLPEAVSLRDGLHNRLTTIDRRVTEKSQC